MGYVLDSIDTKILAMLQNNSNRTTKSIAEALGMTKKLHERDDNRLS